MTDRATEMAVFVRVVEAGSFTAAATRLGLSPSAVSKLVSRLEDRLRARLLNRTTRSLSPTDEGRLYHHHCVRILDEIDEAEQSLGRLRQAPRGLLRVTAATAVVGHQIVPLLPEFLALYPEVRIELNITDRVVDLVEEGFDVAVRVGAMTASTLISRRLAEDHRVICASPAYLDRFGTPAVPADLARHNCLAWTGNPGGLNDWPFIGPDGPYTRRIDGNCEVNAGEALLWMMLAGVGIGRVAAFLVDDDLRSGRLRALLTDTHRSAGLPIHAVYPERRHLSPKVRAFVDFLAARFAARPRPAPLR